MAKYDQLVKALQNAHAAGDTAAAQRIARAIQNKEYEEESSGIASTLQGIGQGATFGLADEIGAGVRAKAERTIAPLLYASGIGVDFAENDDRSFLQRYRDFRDNYYGGDFFERYDDALASQRKALNTARREDPWTTGIAEFVGGLGSGGAGGARAVAGRGLTRGLRNMAGVGAGMGAAAGYGYSEGDPIMTALREVMGSESATGDFDATRRELREAIADTTVGGGLGATAGLALPWLGSIVRGTARFIAKPFTKDARLNEAGRRQIVDALQQDIDAGVLTLDQAKRELASTPGLTISDLSPRLQQLTEDIAQTGTRGGRMIREQLEDRAAGQYDRIMPELSRALDNQGQPSAFFSTMKRMQNEARDEASRLFGQAYRTPITLTRKMDNILQRTEVGKQGLSLSDDLAKEMMRKVPSIGAVGSRNSAERMHLIIQGMDDYVNGLFKNGSGKVAMAARDRRNEFRDLVYAQNSGLRDARAAWGGRKEAEDAMDAGLRLFRDDFDLTQNLLDEMSESGRLHFRLGALRAIERRLGNKVDTADVTRDLMKKRNVRNAIRVAFGDDKRFREFMDLLGQEAKMEQTYRLAVGNSATARRLAQASGDFGEKLAALAGYGVSLSSGIGLPPSIGGYLAQKGYRAGGFPQRAAQSYDQLATNQAGMLMGNDLQRLMRPHTIGGLLDTGVPVTTAAATGGLLASGTLAP